MTRIKVAVIAVAVAAVGVVTAGMAFAQAPRLVRAQSGPAGKLNETGFVFDEVRNRFVYPQDKSLTVYFEWEFLPGDHALTATWRQPDGRVASVSPDVRMQTTTKELSCLWNFQISPGNVRGTWTVEIRIDGQPAGSHAFELAGVDSSDDKFTLDRVVKTFSPALVRVHRLDETGRRVDTGGGFVIDTNAVATAFQVIDMAEALEVEFADGRRARTADVLAMSRLGDWAVLRVDTGNIAPIPRGDSQAIPAGSRLATFNVDAGTRVIMPIDVGAVSAPAGYSARIRFAPAAAPEAVGGPVIDEKGTVVGILGGSVTPGFRLDQHSLDQSPWMWRQRAPGNTATVIADLPPTLPATTKTLAALKASGALTPRLSLMPELTSGGVTRDVPKNVNDRSIQDVTEFSARDDAQVSVYSYWVKHAKLSKGEVSATLFDATNTARASFPAKKISLTAREQRVTIAFSPKGMAAGYYRVDLCWDGQPVWRVYLKIAD